MPKDAITINPNRYWVELLRLTEPELFAHGNNYAIECLIADRLKLHRPRTPDEARAAGGAAGTGEAKRRSRKTKKAK